MAWSLGQRRDGERGGERGDLLRQLTLNPIEKRCDGEENLR